MKPAPIRTSRGYIEEAESIIGNILATIDHLQDIKSDDINNDLQIRQLRNFRDSILKTYATNEIIDLDYHCAYKHLLLIRIQLKELIQSKNSKGQDVSDLNELLKENFDSVLFEIRKKYLNIDETQLKNKKCIRCLEDYHFQRLNNKTIEETENIIITNNRLTDFFDTETLYKGDKIEEISLVPKK